MARVIVQPVATGASAQGSGVSIALSELKSGQYVRIGMSAVAQEKYFGRLLDPETDAIDVLLTDQPGSTHLMGLLLVKPDAEHALPIKAGVKKSISIKVQLWRQVAPGKRPGRQMDLAHSDPGKKVVVKMPDWAQPEPVKKLAGQGRSIME